MEDIGIHGKCYDIILSDPPWKQLKGGLRKCRPSQGRELDYPTMDIASIKQIHEKVSVSDSSILFLWTIDKYLFDSEKMANELGYSLHARIIWDKMNGMAPAFTVRYSHEYLLWFYKAGKFRKIDKSQRGKWTTVIQEISTKHSKKPEISYNMIESLYPTGNKLEMFARFKRDGWDSWGNEIKENV